MAPVTAQVTTTLFSMRMLTKHSLLRFCEAEDEQAGDAMADAVVVTGGIPCEGGPSCPSL